MAYDFNLNNLSIRSEIEVYYTVDVLLTAKPSEAHMRAPMGLPGGTISPTKVAELRGSGASATLRLDRNSLS